MGAEGGPSRVVWADEFETAGARPDPASWTAELGGGGWGCGQLQRYTDASGNAYVDDLGRLVIVARREESGVTSARLVSRGRVSVRYGRVEARVKVPTCAGAWPAFWMLGTDIDEVGWPDCGEIDVMEVVGSQPGVVHATLHAPGYAGLKGGFGRRHDAGVDLAADFHVYAVDWAPERITWLLDDVPYSTVTPDDVPGDSWPFAHDFYLLLNLAVGGDWPGLSADEPDLPATMLVDWVRVRDGTVTLQGGVT